MKLGERLVKEGKITPEQLAIALAEQEKSGEILGKILTRLGFVTQEDISSVLISRDQLEFVDLKNFHSPADLLELIPLEFALKNRILPLALKNGRLKAAMANPLDIVTLDEVRKLTKLPVDPVAAQEDEILEILNNRSEAITETKNYGEDFEVFLAESLQKIGKVITKGGDQELADIGSVIELVDKIIEQAVKAEATDIHIEPDEHAIRLRFRIDGILHSFSSLPKTLQSAVTTRLKIMSNLNISETRLPQDGRAAFLLEGRKIDLRTSFFPCVFGEHIVLRILDREKLLLGLEQLGFSPEMLSFYQELIQRKNGIILVCGPTGSGKTTTLYTTISQLNAREKNIITLEDPVEYLLPLIQQSQINPRAGLTFASGLRAILRQDPDIILVGEIRDQETMEMAMRAALTGHLVFSTLHTNSAAGAFPRLLDMGAEPYLVASSLIAVLSQRLVRLICPFCKEPASVDPLLLSSVGWKGKEVALQKGRGCPRCNHTGYKGRIGLFEFLFVSPRIKNLIVNRQDSSVIEHVAIEEKMVLMKEDGLQKVLQGMTTIEEVLSIV